MLESSADRGCDAGAIPSGDTKDYTLPPEIEKEFDKKFKIVHCCGGGVMVEMPYGSVSISPVKSFFARVIAEEVEKAKREQNQSLW